MGNAALVQGCDGCATGLIDDRELVCIVAGSTTNACISDAKSSGSTPVCAGVEGDPASCALETIGACSSACP
jgi:hypothetical protein